MNETSKRNVYLRLQELDIGKVGVFNVPRLRSYHDECMVVEIEIVSPPFIVDFAGAYLDRSPDFPPEIMKEWERDKRRLFGENWATVKSALAEFKGMGIHLADVKPGNVTF